MCLVKKRNNNNKAHTQKKPSTGKYEKGQKKLSVHSLSHTDMQLLQQDEHSEKRSGTPQMHTLPGKGEANGPQGLGGHKNEGSLPA